MSAEQVADLIQGLGFPIVLVIAMAWAIWQILKWARPKLDSLIETHINFVKRVEGTVERLGDTLEKISSSLSLLPTIHKDVGEIKRHVGIKPKDASEE